MPFPKILSTSEIKEVDEPPVFKNEDRKIFFDIPKFIEDDLSCPSARIAQLKKVKVFY